MQYMLFTSVKFAAPWKWTYYVVGIWRSRE